MKEKSVRIGMLGVGTVGGGVVKILQRNRDLIGRRTGIDFEIVHATVHDVTLDWGVDLDEGVLHDDIEKVVSDDSLQIVIELMGGVDKTGDIVKRVLVNGKDVVTANKAMLAERGEEIYAVAREHGRCIAFEASCCGGIPLVGAMRSGLAANNISEFFGIVNGTCNYVLSSMDQRAKEYEVALKEAQKAGYAEADPTLDINGADSAHKLTILAALAFGKQVDYEQIEFCGIEEVDLTDIRFGRELGYTLKLLASAKQYKGGLALTVHPAFVHEASPMAQVSGAYNAVSIYGDEVGHTLYYGQGAGRFPTASAVVADLIDVARGNSARLFDSMPGFGQPAETAVICPRQERESRFYLRLNVEDQPGVLAQVTKILGDNGISITACLQQEKSHADTVPLIITTHQATQGNMDKALATLNQGSFAGNPTVCIPVVTVPDDHK